MSQSRKVLIVEDEGIVALDIQGQLNDAGFAVTGIAETGARALERVEEDSPYIVLIDIHLKGEMEPISSSHIKATIAMAIHKHRMERDI